MIRAAYSEIAAEDPREARRVEGEAFDRVLALLEAARAAAPDAAARRDALEALERLWTVLLHDLAHADNALPPDLRAQLISVGLWVLRETGRLHLTACTDVDGLIAVNASIRAGLS